MKRKRFVFNCMRLFYIKEKPTTPPYVMVLKLRRNTCNEKLMKTKKNGENIYKVLNAWLRNCRSILAFRGNKGYKERDQKENAWRAVEQF